MGLMTHHTAPDLFRCWQEALAALEHAEALDAPYAELMRLSENVIRARNQLTCGTDPISTPAEISRYLADEQLLTERDDTR